MGQYLDTVVASLTRARGIKYKARGDCFYAAFEVTLIRNGTEPVITETLP